MILRAGILITMNGAPLENGAVALEDNVIVDAGSYPAISARYVGDELDLSEQVLLPGLINAHCHLDYTRLRGKIPRPQSFTRWIQAINGEKEKLTEQDYVGAIEEGFSECRKFGTTSIVNLEAFPKLIQQIKPPIRTWWMAEMIDVRQPNAADEILHGAMEAVSETQRWGLAPHSPYTASCSLYRRCAAIAAQRPVVLTTHLAESREETAMFRASAGPLYDFLAALGRDMSDCGEVSSLEAFLRCACSGGSPNETLPWLIAHLNELDESDFQRLNGCRAAFHIVHCPRSHEYFSHSPFAFERLRGLGFNICLGTDSLASNLDLSLFAEMRTFHTKHPELSPEALLEMVTINAARAIGQENAVGRIAPGFYADFIAIPRKHGGNIFEQIVAFEGTVPWLMVDGRVIEQP